MVTAVICVSMLSTLTGEVPQSWESNDDNAIKDTPPSHPNWPFGCCFLPNFNQTGSLFCLELELLIHMDLPWPSLASITGCA